MFLLAKRRRVPFRYPLETHLRHTTFLPCARRLKSIRNSSSATLTKPYYVTTPIFYPNASPHVGHLYTLVIGDVFARYQRLRRNLPSDASNNGDVEFLAGTDEHGMKIQKAAKTHFGVGGREQEFCDSLTERFRGLARKANISNTCFMRTTSEEHKRAVEDVWRKLMAKGYIYKGNYSGWYSVTDECFYTHSQVTRVTTASASSSPLSVSTETPTFAPNLEPDTFQTISIETGSRVEWSEEENYMFRLSAFRDDLLQYYRDNVKSVYPEQYREEVLKMLGDTEDKSFSLADISISRPRTRLEWGIPVPDDSSQTVYVWFDALLIYLTGSGYPWPAAEHGKTAQMGCWPADLQVIGKDILRFHAVYLPAILRALSASPPAAAGAESNMHALPLSRTILAHAHWTSSQKKMSKSLGNVADPWEAIDRWGVDVVRFYLIRVGGRWKDDVDWSSSQLEKHQKEIQAQLGNYFLRISSPRLAARVASALHGGEVTLEACFSEEVKSLLGGALLDNDPCKWIAKEDVDVDSPPDTMEPNYELLKAVLALPEKVHGHMEKFEAGLALGEIMGVLKLANKIFSVVAPWAPNTRPHVIHTTRIVALETARIVGGCLEPFMPTTSEKLREALGVENRVLQKCTRLQPPSNQGQRPCKANELWDRWSGRDVVPTRLL